VLTQEPRDEPGELARAFVIGDHISPITLHVSPNTRTYVEDLTRSKIRQLSADSRLLLLSAAVLALLMTTGLLTLRQSPGDLPESYFVVLATALITLIMEAFLVRDFRMRHAYVILGQLLVLYCFARLAEWFRYPSILGYDSYAHLATTETIIETGHIDFTARASSAFPALQILMTHFVEVTGLDTKTMFVLVSLCSAFGVIYFFFVARRLLPVRWATLAAIVVSSLPYFGFWTTVQISPTTVGVILALLTLSGVLAEYHTPSTEYRILTLISGAALVIAHPILALFVIWILACLAVTHATMHGRASLGWPVRAPFGSLSILIGILILAYWIYLNRAWAMSIAILANILNGGVGSFPHTPWLSPPVEIRALYYLPYAMLIVGSFYSGLAWLLRGRSQPLRTGWSVIAVGIGVVTGYGFLTGEDFSAFVNRWLLLLEMVTAILFVATIGLLLTKAGRVRSSSGALVVSILIVSSVVSPVASLLPNAYQPTLAFSPRETAGIGFANRCNATLVADSYAGTYIHVLMSRPTADLYGYSLGLPRTFDQACILLREKSDTVFTKTATNTRVLIVDFEDFAPGLTRLPVGFSANLSASPSLTRIFDDGDVVWFQGT